MAELESIPELRITPEEVREAYLKCELRPMRGTFYTLKTIVGEARRIPCACAIGAITIARTGLASNSRHFTDLRYLGFRGPYLRAFSAGFEGQSLDEAFDAADEAWEAPDYSDEEVESGHASGFASWLLVQDLIPASGEPRITRDGGIEA